MHKDRRQMCVSDIVCLCGCSEVSCRHRVPLGSLLLCLAIFGSWEIWFSQFHLQSCSGPCALGWFLCPSYTAFHLSPHHGLSLSPFSLISLSDYLLSFSVSLSCPALISAPSTLLLRASVMRESSSSTSRSAQRQRVTESWGH